MPLDPYFAARLPVLLPDLCAVKRRELLGDPAHLTHPGVTVQETTIAGPHGPIPLRVYRPAGEPGAALLWAHGGGFRSGDLTMPEAHVVSAELARRAGALVVSVGYRLAVAGVHYPVPLDDVRTAWAWLRRQAPDLPTALGGASAGAALALATALRDGSVDMLLFAYPFVHFPVPALDPGTVAELTAVPAILRYPPEKIEEMVRNYVGRISDLPTDALPGSARLDDLAPTWLVLCEYDELRPSGEMLHRQLTEAGVPVRSQLARGAIHGHLNWAVRLPVIDESLTFLAGALSLAEYGTPGETRSASR